MDGNVESFLIFWVFGTELDGISGAQVSVIR